ncbi:MAG: hypothetical protein ACKOWN_02260 [Microbacteriaceae bacterium]
MRPGVSLAGVAGVGILLFGLVMAPFTTIAISQASMLYSNGSEYYVAPDGSGTSIQLDSWSLTSTLFTVSTAEVREAQDYALSQLQARGLDEAEFICLVNLWGRESRWSYRAENRRSGAYGIPQALPGRKMASEGADWRTNPRTQIDWGLGYIADRYETPCRAWQHSEDEGWY